MKTKNKFGVLNKYIYKLGIDRDTRINNIITMDKNIFKVNLKRNNIIISKLIVTKAVVKSSIKALGVYNVELLNYSSMYKLSLNFKRNRFFTCFDTNKSGETIFNNSLGIISKRFSERKSYLKSKSSYIMSSSYIRRVLIYLNISRMQINILKTPKFLRDIMNNLTTNTNSLYRDPFISGKLVNEKELNPAIYFEYVMFVNNKALGPIKKKKRGRLKRKISKKVIAYNNMLD